jgi:hypothetical protein
MLYIIQTHHRCDIILSFHVPTEDKTDDVKESFHEKLGHVIDKFHKYHMKMFLRDFNAKAGREDIFKLTVGNESSHEINDGNGIRVVNTHIQSCKQCYEELITMQVCNKMQGTYCLIHYQC